MCGIAGIVCFDETGMGWMKNLNPATDILSKRGPDAGNFFYEKKVGLGHRRLSIIDVSEQANQPMFDNTGRYVIVFNGEIFNYRELKKELISQGATFTNQSDTEVILELYKKEKTNFLNKLNGFFAFAIYDKIEESLFIARDRFGIKPLLYYQDENTFVFSSEMKSMLQFPIKRNIDINSLYQYFQLNYIPTPYSIFQDIKKLKPGHSIFISGNKIEDSCYYTIPAEELVNQNLSYDDAQKELVKLLEDSVERRLIADVPLGAFLSGGIDSSVVVALASRFTKNLNTFSIGYKDEKFFDETHYAELVAKKYKTNHTVFKLTNTELFEDLNNVLDYIDEPFADSSALPIHILCKHTRQAATVALSGDGADELFGGYMKHVGEYRVRQGGASAQIVSLLSPLWNSIPKSRNGKFYNKIRQVKKFSEGMKMNARDRYYRWCGVADEEEVDMMLMREYHPNEAAYLQRKKEATEFITGGKSMNDVLRNDMNLVLVNDMLPKVDLMSMANSLEVRVPFLDYRVVNFAFSLPADFKIMGTERKRIVQDAFRNILPEELYNRPKKGFEVPLLKWFRTGLYSLINDDLLSADFVEEQGIFNMAEIQKMKRKLFSSNPEDIHARIWALIVFQSWWKKYIV